MGNFNGTRVTSIVARPDVEIMPGYSERSVQQIARAAVSRAQSKNVPHDSIDTLFVFARDTLKVRPTCECCLIPFNMNRTGRGPAKASLTIHRRIPAHGYTVSNLHLICHGCNIAIGEVESDSDITKRINALQWHRLQIRN